MKECDCRRLLPPALFISLSFEFLQHMPLYSGKKFIELWKYLYVWCLMNLKWLIIEHGGTHSLLGNKWPI